MEIIEIKQILTTEYNLSGDYYNLPGYEDENYKLVTENGEQFVVKVTNCLDDLAMNRVKNLMLNALSQSELKSCFPKVLKNSSGDFLSIFEKQNCIIRVISWVDGELFANITPDKNLFENLGSFLAKSDNVLKTLDIQLLKTRNYTWDIDNALLSEKLLKFIQDPEIRRITNYYFLQFKQFVLPKLSDLRKSNIHGDANDLNLFVKNNTISGLIDFGDAVYSSLINEVAVAITYAVMNSEDPIKDAASIVKGYSNVEKLTEIELSILYYLVAARLSISICQSSFASFNNPENRHQQISENGVKKLLKTWISINPRKAENSFRVASGFSKIAETKIADFIEERHKHISPLQSISYDQPINMIKAAFQYMYDDKGNSWLDCVNNIMHVGHCHPDVVRAGQNQMAELNTNTRYLYDNLNQYSKRLCSLLPDPLDVVFFVNSGSEAGDLAQRIARTVTKQKSIIVLENAYHGNTLASIEASPYKYEKKNGFGKAEHVFKVSRPDMYRGKFLGDDSANHYAQDIENAIDEIKNGGKSLAAFYAESIPGCGGQTPFPKGYLKKAYTLTREAGGVTIADEVQTGYGRAGKYFWAFQQQDVIPDIVVLGKPIGNGHPMAAVVTSKEIADKFNNGIEYFNSFGGNPVSCAIGLSVLDVIKNENLQKSSESVGNYLMDGFRKMQNQYPIIGDVRGFGLFVGVELVLDRETKEPATELAEIVVDQMRKSHILMSTEGPFENILKIKPPLCFSKENADFVLTTVDKILSDIQL